jgi:hypothetical protein
MFQKQKKDKSLSGIGCILTHGWKPVYGSMWGNVSFTKEKGKYF